MKGRLVAFVGPSGVGKDTLMRAVAAARPGTGIVRRVITRPEAAGGEDFEGASPEAFRRMHEAGRFVLAWEAHGFSYGIPQEVRAQVAAGDTLVNLSRSVLTEAARQFPTLVVLAVTAQAGTLAARLAGRGRETADEIAARLGRAGLGVPPGVPATEVPNDGSVEDAVALVLRRLQPVRV